MDFIRDFVDPGLFVSHLINFLILFFLFKHFLGDHLTNAIKTRREQMAKMENVDAEYEKIINTAEWEKKKIIDEALAHKNNVVAQAEQTATLKADKIIADAGARASNIETEAQEKAGHIQKELEDGFVDGVKKTAHTVVKKLFDKDVKLQEEYLVELAKEFSK